MVVSPFKNCNIGRSRLENTYPKPIPIYYNCIYLLCRSSRFKDGRACYALFFKCRTLLYTIHKHSRIFPGIDLDRSPLSRRITLCYRILYYDQCTEKKCGKNRTYNPFGPGTSLASTFPLHNISRASVSLL
jgi:hypothetical protein